MKIKKLDYEKLQQRAKELDIYEALKTEELRAGFILGLQIMYNLIISEATDKE